jgi:hypothetical protein
MNRIKLIILYMFSVFKDPKYVLVRKVTLGKNLQLGLPFIMLKYFVH